MSAVNTSLRRLAFPLVLVLNQSFPYLYPVHSSMNQENRSPTPPPYQREQRRSDTQKVKGIRRYMANKCNHLSLRQFLETLFTSDGDLHKSANIFLTSGCACGVLDEWAKKIPSEEMLEWVMERAVKACRRKFSFLTDRASRGPQKKDADFLRIPASQISASLLEEFKLDDLNSRYALITPQFQRLLKGIIEKEDEGEENVTDSSGRKFPRLISW
ncbi:hypothetical protein BDZ97DRAFT_2031091 [Flammula alnicola]|nr:hypothetical protein BDZ97DRAFT_2031091 [Flammula alnicola]